MIKRPSKQQALDAVRVILEYIGENPDREGLVDTPKRVVESYNELFGGYKLNPEEVLATTFTETEDYDSVITLENIEFSSFCEHHILPINGYVTISYVPDKRVVGISKLARLVELYARRLQIQERLTANIASAIFDYLKPKWIKVEVVATHSCMTLRGVNKQSAQMKTEKIIERNC